MFNRIVLIFLIIVLNSCSSSEPVNKKNVADSVPEFPVETVDSILDHKVVADTILVPSRHFLVMTAFLDSCNFIADTSRAKKVGYYKRWIGGNSIFLNNGIPFYKLKTHPIIRYMENYVGNVSTDSFILDTRTTNFKNLSQVKNITGYFFKDKVSTFKELTTDGFIEEWEFENPKDAEKAAKSISDFHWPVYVNCIYYSCRNDNYIYILSSRSDWDAKKLEPIFIKLIKKRSYDPNAIISTQ